MLRTKSKSFIYNVGRKSNADVVITGNRGTTGDIEPTLEAIRQVSLEQGRGNSLFIHVTLVPYLKSSGEHKSKPTAAFRPGIAVNGDFPGYHRHALRRAGG